MSNWIISSQENFDKKKFAVNVGFNQSFEFADPAVKQHYYSDLDSGEQARIQALLGERDQDDEGVDLVFLIQVEVDLTLSDTILSLEEVETQLNGQSQLWVSFQATPINAVFVIYDIGNSSQPMRSATKSKGKITKPDGTTGG